MRYAAVAICLVAALACKEGEGVIVRHLTFEGVHQVPEAELRLALTTASSSRWPLSEKTYYSKQDFTEDLKRLESFYASHGFPDAHVTSFRTAYNDNKTSMDLTVIVDEGRPTVVEAVDFVGFDALPAAHLESLRSHMPLVVGHPRDQEQAQVLRGMALDELRDHGYPAAVVALTEKPGAGPQSVVVTLTATPGAFAKIGDIVIKGNTSVDQRVILRQLAFKRGDEFSLSALQRSQQRLYALELFQFANVETGDTASTPGTVQINITVLEAPHRQLTFGVGYGSEDHARVQSTFRHVNFLGGARTAGVEGKFSSLDRGLRLSFNEPSLGHGISLGVNGQSWFASTPAYTLRTNGGRVGLLRSLSGREITPGTKARSSVSLSFAREYESYQVSEAALSDKSFRPTLIALGLNPSTGQGSGTVTAFTADVQRNTVDHLLDAKRGSLLSVHAETAGKVLGGDFAYREISGEARVYFSVTPSMIFAVHARAGTIGGAGDPETSVPFFKRYFLGGATSLRGWGRFEVAPLTAEGLPIGGFSMFESSAELRLTPGGGTSTFGVVAFADAGNVWNTTWHLTPNDLRADVGLGARYRTPVGPLRFDFAYQLTPNSALVLQGRAPGDYRRWRFHFSIGQSF